MSARFLDDNCGGIEAKGLLHGTYWQMAFGSREGHAAAPAGL